jgi:hypothetical protein
MANLRITVDGQGRRGASSQTIGSIEVRFWGLYYDLLSPQTISTSDYFWTEVSLGQDSDWVRTAGGRAVRINLVGSGNRRTVSVDVAADSGFQIAAGEVDIPIASHGAVRADLEITGWIFRVTT